MGKLIEMYSSEGYDIVTGIDFRYVGKEKSDFTYIFKDMKSQTGCLGIAAKEIYFLEHLFSSYSPENIFIIGNSFGWSSLAIGLLNPSSNIVAIELGDENFTFEWIEKTNKIAQKWDLPVTVYQGRSPDDTAKIVSEHLSGRIDFSFIDGDHTIPSVIKDFEEVSKFSTQNTCHLFHDIISHDLSPALSDIANRHKLQGNIFYGTPSGMAIAYKEPPVTLDITAKAFGASPIALGFVSSAAKRAGLIR